LCEYKTSLYSRQIRLRTQRNEQHVRALTLLKQRTNMHVTHLS